MSRYETFSFKCQVYLLTDVTQPGHGDAESRRRNSAFYTVFHLHHTSGVVSASLPSRTVVLAARTVWQKLRKVSY